MFTEVTLRVVQVWDDALWRARTVYQEDDVSEPVILEKSGRVALGADRGPDELLAAALAALERAPYAEPGQE